VRVMSIHAGATVRLASAGPGAPALKVGDEVGADDALRVENAPPWPTPTVEFEPIDRRARIGKARVGR